MPESPHRGQVIAAHILLHGLTTETPLDVMLVARTTRYDDGHLVAWHIEVDSASSKSWPTRTRLDPSCVVVKDGKWCLPNGSMGMLYPLAMGPRTVCLDDIDALCYRAALPDPELGEDGSTWCMDVLIKLEALQAVEKGQSLAAEEWISQQTRKRRAVVGENHLDVLGSLDTTGSEESLKLTAFAC